MHQQTSLAKIVALTGLFLFITSSLIWIAVSDENVATSELIDMSPGSFVTLAFEEDENYPYGPLFETYIVESVGVIGAILKGPGPSSEEGQLREIRFLDSSYIVGSICNRDDLG